MPMNTDDELYDYIFRTTADGIIMADAEGHVLRINPAAAAMLGTTVEQVKGKAATVCFGTNPALVSLFRKTEDYTTNVRLPRKRFGLGIGKTLNNTRLVIIQDVTERRELESRR
ncbi:MAG: PAS domain S-box protein, partial [Chloroflexota bacterium]